MQTNPDDRKVVEELVKQAQQGHQPAFAGLYERCYDQIYRFVSFKCGSATEAEDITGEVFLKMLESIHTFKWKGHPFTSWLYRIAHNQVVDNFRRKGRRQTVPLDDAKERTGINASDLERAAEINMTMTEVMTAMDSLTDLQREVISLRFGSGLSVSETAEAVGRKDNAVKALQHAGIKKLRASMAPEAPAITPVIEGDV
jgi:RNA polymerase sigma-70 factor (ECF subfamily)